MCAPASWSRPRGGRGAASAVVALLEGGIEGPADDEPAHLAGARPDLVEFGVAQEAPHGVVIDVTVPTCHTKKATSHSLSLISGWDSRGKYSCTVLGSVQPSATHPGTGSHPGPPVSHTLLSTGSLRRSPTGQSKGTVRKGVTCPSPVPVLPSCCHHSTDTCQEP